MTINGAQAINMPKQGENILKFNNFHKQRPVPFVIYADFEAIRKKVQGCKQSEEMNMDIQIKKEKSKTSMSMPSPIIWKNIWPLCWVITSPSSIVSNL